MKPMKGCTILGKEEQWLPPYTHGDIGFVSPSHSPSLWTSLQNNTATVYSSLKFVQKNLECRCLSPWVLSTEGKLFLLRFLQTLSFLKILPIFSIVCSCWPFLAYLFLIFCSQALKISPSSPLPLRYTYSFVFDYYKYSFSVFSFIE